MKTIVLILIIIVIILIGGIFAIAAAVQDVTVNVNLTMLDVIVEDEDGHAVRDLARDAFEILENGDSKALAYFEVQNEPVTLGLLIDRSSSIATVRKELDRTAAHLLERLGPADEVFLMTFATDAKLVLHRTTDLSRVTSAIGKTKLSYGSRFYDALVASMQSMPATSRPKALIVFSDGADHYSLHTLAETLKLVRWYGDPIYIFAYDGDDPRSWPAAGRDEIHKTITQIAQKSGGKACFSSQAGVCFEFARNIAELLGRTYKIGFYSSAPAGTPSNIQVRLRGERGSRFTVRITNDALPF